MKPKCFKPAITVARVNCVVCGSTHTALYKERQAIVRCIMCGIGIALKIRGTTQNYHGGILEIYPPVTFRGA